MLLFKMDTNNNDMEDSVKERLRYFLRTEKIKATDFCIKIGVSSGFISGMRESIQPDKLKSIAINYPELDISWLLTGLGDMIKPDVQGATLNNVKGNVVANTAGHVGGNVDMRTYSAEKIIRENGDVELYGDAQSVIEKLEVEKSVLQNRITDLENMLSMKDEIISVLKENIGLLKK